MDRSKLEELLRSVEQGAVPVDEALERLKHFPFKDLGFARVDSHRALRQGLPEVIFCPGKSPSQIAAIGDHLATEHALVLATRAERDVAFEVGTLSPDVRYIPDAKILYWGELPEEPYKAQRVALLTAGTADVPVAEECAWILAAAGYPIERVYDVGVAGIHRLMANLEKIRACDVVIAAAGMDGVLPSVTAGLVAGPVIAIPTSVGYGASFDGLAALLTMLNSCAAGLTVVNIDNGFGAAVAAIRIMTAFE